MDCTGLEIQKYARKNSINHHLFLALRYHQLLDRAIG